VLQPLCSEIAEISDDEVFADSLNFIKDQWQNVRMQKRASVPSVPSEEHKEDTQVEEDAEAGREAEDQDAHGKESAEGMGVECEDQSQSEAPLSQAHSLYSTELGRVQAVGTKGITLPRPTADVFASQGDVDVDMNDGSNGGAADADSGMDENETPNLHRPQRVNINQRVAKTGHPHLDRAVVASQISQERVRFNAASTARRANGNVGLAQLLDALDSETPSLENVQKRLVGVTEKFTQLSKCRPKYLTQADPVVVEDVYYFLPPALMEKCFKVLPIHNVVDDAISIASSSQDPSQQERGRQESRRGSKVEVVKVKDLLFRRSDIETMERARRLKNATDDGLRLLRWLRVDLAPRVPALLQSSVHSVADRLAGMYPGRVVEVSEHWVWSGYAEGM
jgi:hypothetical protein